MCAARTAWMNVNTETTRVQNVEHMLAHTIIEQTIYGTNNIPVVSLNLLPENFRNLNENIKFQLNRFSMPMSKCIILN